MAAYGVFLVVAMSTCFREHFRKETTVRDWLGSAGLAACSISSFLYLPNYIVRVFWYTEIARGSALVIYYDLGELLSILGFVLGLAGKGRVRLFSLIASVVMSLQWLGWMTYGRRVEAFIANVTYFSTGLIVAIAVIHRLLSSRRSDSAG